MIRLSVGYSSLIAQCCRRTLPAVMARNCTDNTNGSSSKLCNTVSLKRTLCNRIRHFGPITISEFMKECLINPLKGYYMKNDVFGKHGDFITSPDICQIFGEIIGVWFVNQWKMNSYIKLQLVEVGPGRGTLMSDILRVFSRLNLPLENISLRLVEISPKMRELQSSTLKSTIEQLGMKLPNIDWYDDINELPRNLTTFIVAHEFLDALPVHQFRKDESGNWREVMVEIGPMNSQAQQEELRLVLSPTPTVAQSAYLRPIEGMMEKRDCVEICPRAMLFVNEACQRIESDGGAALIIDYGHLGEKGDTFRAFRNHRLCDPLSEPGEVDVTCDVDFFQLCHQISSSGFNIGVHGPESQAYFLINMGLLTRLEMLLSKCESQSQQDDLLSGCEMLLTDEQMGGRFKFMAIVPQDPLNRPIPGFVDLPGTPYAEQSPAN